MNTTRIGILIVSAAFISLASNGSAQSTMGTLKVDADPGRTGVFVDGKYLGPAANFKRTQKYSLTPGQHSVRLSEPRYKDHTATIQIEAGKTFTIEHDMEKLPAPVPPFGGLRIEKGKQSKFAGVFLNNQFTGHVGEYDGGSQKLLVQPGKYQLKVVSPEGQTILDEAVSLTADKTTVVRLPDK